MEKLFLDFSYFINLPPATKNDQIYLGPGHTVLDSVQVNIKKNATVFMICFVEKLNLKTCIKKT